MNPESPNILKIFTSIKEIPETHWQEKLPPGAFFHQYRFIQAVEAARIEKSTCWYALLEDAQTGELKASAAFSVFTVNLDLFVEGMTRKLIHGVRKVFPGFMRIKVLFCGLPISLGQHNLHLFVEEEEQPELVTEMVKAMEAYAVEHQIDFLCIKEFKLPEQEPIHVSLSQAGYLFLPSLPYMTLDLHWPDFEGWLGDLRHGYRRQVRASLKKMGVNAPNLQKWSEARKEDPGPQWLWGGPEVCDAETFHRLYLLVMSRAETQLETLNLAFFQELYTRCPEDLIWLSVVAEGEILAVALLNESDGAMNWMLVGQGQQANETYDPYFNLMYGIISLALERGCHTLNLGQTAYWVKQRLGGKPVPEYLYFKCRKKWIHRLIEKFPSEFFPHTELPEIKVFKKREGNKKTV